MSSEVSSHGFGWRPFFLFFFFFLPEVAVAVAVLRCRPWLVGGVVPGVESRSGMRASLAEGIQPGGELRALGVLTPAVESAIAGVVVRVKRERVRAACLAGESSGGMLRGSWKRSGVSESGGFVTKPGEGVG